MKDPILETARERGLADERGLYLAANVFADGKQLGRVWAFLNGTLLTPAELDFPCGSSSSGAQRPRSRASWSPWP